MIETRHLLLLASACFFLLLGSGCAGYSKAVHNAQSGAAWVDARVAGLYECAAAREIDRLESVGGSVEDFERWERENWSAVIAASDIVHNALEAAAAADDAGDAAGAATAIARAAEAIQALMSALDAKEVRVPVWIRKAVIP